MAADQWDEIAAAAIRVYEYHRDHEAVCSCPPHELDSGCWYALDGAEQQRRIREFVANALRGLFA